MTRYFALLRGINVGGKRKILMADLSLLFVQLGYKNIQTYIQTGNVIFDLTNKKEAGEVELDIHQAIFKQYEFEVPVIIRNIKEMQEIILNNPFAESYAVERLYLSFLKEKPDTKQLEKIKLNSFLPDDFIISDRNIYGYCATKYSESKYGNTFFEKHLKVEATTRNWKTVNKLYEIATND